MGLITCLLRATYLPTLVGVVVLTVLTAIACDPGVGVSYVNNTGSAVLVEVNDGGEVLIKPHSKITLDTIGVDDDPYITVVRDEGGNTLYREETTIGEIKKRKQPIVIEEPTPSATPP